MKKDQIKSRSDVVTLTFFDILVANKVRLTRFGQIGFREYSEFKAMDDVWLPLHIVKFQHFLLYIQFLKWNYTFRYCMHHNNKLNCGKNENGENGRYFIPGPISLTPTLLL